MGVERITQTLVLAHLLGGGFFFWFTCSAVFCKMVPIPDLWKPLIYTWASKHLLYGSPVLYFNQNEQKNNWVQTEMATMYYRFWITFTNTSQMDHTVSLTNDLDSLEMSIFLLLDIKTLENWIFSITRWTTSLTTSSCFSAVITFNGWADGASQTLSAFLMLSHCQMASYRNLRNNFQLLIQKHMFVIQISHSNTERKSDKQDD